MQSMQDGLYEGDTLLIARKIRCAKDYVNRLDRRIFDLTNLNRFDCDVDNAKDPSVYGLMNSLDEIKSLMDKLIYEQKSQICRMCDKKTFEHARI